MADVFQHSTALSWLPPPDETKIIVREFPVNLSGEDSYSLVGPHALCTLHYSVVIDNWGEIVSEIAFCFIDFH